MAVINDACTGCAGSPICITECPVDTILEGCPWDAIDMVPIDEYEKTYGELPY